MTFKVCDTARHAGAGAGQAGAPLCVPLAVEQGLVFELNNRLAHSVVNDAGRVRLAGGGWCMPVSYGQLHPA